MCGRTLLIIWNDDSMPLCCTVLFGSYFLFDRSLISTKPCLSTDLIFNSLCCKIIVYEFRAVFTSGSLVLVYTQEGSLWSIVLRCDDHTGIFTCDGCARDPYFYVPAETQSYVIKLSCSRKVLAASGD